MKGIFELDEMQGFDDPCDNLMLVDCLNLAFRYKHKGQFDFAADYLRTIASLAKSYKAGKVILLADKGSSAYRKNVHPGYKGDRAERYANQTDEEKEKAQKFFEGYERALELVQKQYNLLRYEKVEADDLAALVVKDHAHKFPHVWLVSSDADWDLLLRNNVSRFSFVTRKEYTVENFYDEHGCDNPTDYTSIKVLMGDKGDSVDGIPSIGIKRAYGLVREYGSAVDILDLLPLPGKQKFVENLNNSSELILRNYELMDLLSYCEDAISYPNQESLPQIKSFLEEYLNVKD